MTKLYLISLLLIQGIVAYGQESKVPQSFKNLSKVELINNNHSNTFESPKVYFNDELTVVVNKEVNSTSIFYDDFAKMVGLHEFIITKINRSKEEEYHILFDYGMSADPSFSIAKKDGDSFKQLGSISGLILYIPGNGNIYSEGHVNNYFNERKKYKLINDRLVEAKQPYRYVGIKTKTKGLLKLYTDKTQEELIATLPPEADIEILLNDNDYYLIKTSFGLVGWWKFSDSKSEIKEDIFFKGD